MHRPPTILPDDAATHPPLRRLWAGVRRRLSALWRRFGSGETSAAAIAQAAATLEGAVASTRPRDWSPEEVATIAEALRLVGRKRLGEAWTRDDASPSETRRAPSSGRRTATLRAAERVIAAARRVAETFARQADVLPEEIALDDGRVARVREWLAESKAAACDSPRVADVGCGSGRFLRVLRAELPSVRWAGIDLSAAMLARLPEGVERIEGSLLDLPCGDAAFDAAFCVEALEHALEPRAAVAELCRVVRPGGAVLIVDKRRERQAASACEPWERWFAADEVAAWLAPYCDSVEVREVAHGRGSRGLFLAWSGVIKPAATRDMETKPPASS